MENKKSPVRTFFILHRETILEAPPRFELGIKVLQTFALPLGYSADWSGLRGSNSLPPPWQGGALPDELNPQEKNMQLPHPLLQITQHILWCLRSESNQ